MEHISDEIPAGEIVNLTPTDKAMIFLKIEDDFPTQEFLGPLIVNRPELEFREPMIVDKLPTLDKEILS